VDTGTAPLRRLSTSRGLAMGPSLSASCGCRSGVRGCDDRPGFAHLSEFSPLLYVGNRYSAAAGDGFGAVISTVTPLGLGGVPAPQLSTCAIHFEDGHGGEDDDEVAVARASIVRGSDAVARAVADGRLHEGCSVVWRETDVLRCSALRWHCAAMALCCAALLCAAWCCVALRGAGAGAGAALRWQRTLVHCEWGQNRSGSICCAYAILHKGWAADDAIAYMQARNFADRQYVGQSPMSNKCFNEIMRHLEREHEDQLEDASVQKARPGDS